MQINSVTYTDTDGTRVRIETADGTLFAPWPIQSWHREVIEKWLAKGNAIQPCVEPPAPVPDEATVLQLYDEMDQSHGIDLEDAVAGRGQKAVKRFRLANTIRRDDPMVTQLQTALGWTDAQRDALFVAAAKRV